jgi:general secretion pathway protein E
VFCRDLGDRLEIVYKKGVSPAIFAEVRRYVGAGQALMPRQMEAAAFDDALHAAYEQDSTETMQMVQGLGDEMDLERLASEVPEAEDLRGSEDDAPIIRLINAVLMEAVKENASDIHIETFERTLSIRFRVDGVLREAVHPKRALAPLLVSRIKVMAKLDIAEKRVPQDGRLAVRVGGKEVDVRVSTMPSNHGERVVLRLLEKDTTRLNLTTLGMVDDDMVRFKNIIHRPHGIVLVTGPTGSGKTTTLYAALSELNDHSRNILTIEDPIEYNLEGVGQTQVNVKAEMTFARGLRAMLRQDPDVVMVGEIRDTETAQIAVQASLTGHLVMSTLHTNSAVGAITRLQDMGVEPFLLSSSLTGVIAQRLMRVLCPDCKEPHMPDEFEREFLGLKTASSGTLFRAKGCASCNRTGYKGRTAIYELVDIDAELRHLIHSQVAEAELLEAVRHQSAGLRADGIRTVRAGLSTVEELLRVTQEI